METQTHNQDNVQPKRLVQSDIDSRVVNEKLTAEQRERLVDLILFCYHEWKKQ